MVYSRPTSFWLLVLLAVAFAPCVNAADRDSAARQEFFETRIRPVLVEQCYECHNTAKTQEGGLALDHRQALLTGGETGPALLPGNPNASLLLQVLRHEVEGYEMPKAGPKLSAAVIADFEKWIRDGAVDTRDTPPSAEELSLAASWPVRLEKRKQWWSFQPIKSPAVPTVQSPDWCRTPVDNFILVRLEQAQLPPSPDADSAVLLRRVFFVLTGLPPTPDEQSQWIPLLDSHDPVVFPQLVDTLLARPQFGEHWARHWMDWLRYAESHGSEGDPLIGNAWHYRDYLIRALNTDVSYDQLVREHIAGDLLEQPRVNTQLQLNESLIGPAHWRMVFHGFSPTDALDEKVRFVDDQVNVFSKAFLGLTVSCARCHNHKFDAISQADYYALFGVLGSCRPGRVIVDLPAVQQQNSVDLADLKLQIRTALADAWLEKLSTAVPAWFAAAKDSKESSRPLQPLLHMQQAVASGGMFAAAWQTFVDQWQADQQRQQQFLAGPHFRQWRFDHQADAESWFRTGFGLSQPNRQSGDFTIALEGSKLLSGIYPAGVYSHALSTKHPARFSSPDMALDDEYEVWLQTCGDGGAIARYAVQNYPRSGTIFPVLKPTPRWQWLKLDLSYWKGDDAYLEIATALDAPLPVSADTRSWFGLRNAVVTKKGTTPPSSKFREYAGLLIKPADRTPPESFPQLQSRFADTLAIAIRDWKNGQFSDVQADLLQACLEESLLPNDHVSLSTVRPLVERYRVLEAEIAVPTRVPGLEETLGRDQPLYVRGDHKQPAELVPRRFLEAVDAEPYAASLSGRRELAEDLLRSDNPLTRRVIVNRVWLHLFDQGLVRTPDNFGKMGFEPTHPELLDWLALHFTEQKGSLKSLIRELVLSRTWQLSSVPSERAREIDPENQLLSHAAVRRLEAESIRDSLLTASGDIDLNLFGPPTGGNSNRRSIYVEVRRNSLDPVLRVFDFPEPFSATGRRDVTNVPAQSLTLLNDPRIQQRAHSWASRLLQNNSQTDGQRIQQMFATAFGRSAQPQEIEQALAYVRAASGRHKKQQQHRHELDLKLAAVERQLADLTAVAREQLPQANAVASNRMVPSPIGRWEFDGDLNDVVGSATAKPVGNIQLVNGSVNLNGGYLVTPPLEKTLTEKTLEAWVQLDTLDQQGGGVMSIQSRDGAVFDAIVFGEQSPREWLAGSDHFHRTKPFQGPPEQAPLGQTVHLAIVYAADGLVTGYRDGLPYGKPYRSAGLVEFPAGQTVVTFGLRHLPAGGNKLLSGRILKAQLYDRALTADEVHASSLSLPTAITNDMLLAALPDNQRQQFITAQVQQTQLKSQLAALPPVTDHRELAAWSELARALFLFKEFIYLK
ncbi:DUF1553 domain-containing protein [Planctomicrobium piriforme]|uniref:Concanavalin A-like lectin/glucanases superfamily protein n=1 Tax=Planctomicrobium piriforme TaxID=1576369 RepID=A0A1I3T3K7_9PLAN|nr:DUF1553 domain-containing protein [Planctomicrobium piriforme]SFJ65545.1 Concanavalin A-like lectin/glucanases superfamily protein [Planctomicrobium piriforme]